jgi:hypothetical protein
MLNKVYNLPLQLFYFQKNWCLQNPESHVHSFSLYEFNTLTILASSILEVANPILNLRPFPATGLYSTYSCFLCY